MELILGITFGTIFLGVGLYLEIRRRKKKRAMERYAIKRMRRKFKGVDRGGGGGGGKRKKKTDIDWRSYYDEGKGKKGKKKKKGKDKKKKEKKEVRFFWRLLGKVNRFDWCCLFVFFFFDFH